LRPRYCGHLRSVMHDLTLPVFLNLDNCFSYNKAELLTLYAHRNIQVIWPHRPSTPIPATFCSLLT
jgi:hypothetical protein